MYITTESGSEGTKGYVTDIFSPLDYNAVICCGPEVMMKKVVDICNRCATPVYVSMEEHMACGVGACLVCTCKTTKGMKRTCKEGPVFSGREVVLGA
jgi:dihydroorotate dehydrogenase electron transfer subunit